MSCFSCSIIVVTTQFMSPALHKNFSEADFDFKVCVCVNVRVCVCMRVHARVCVHARRIPALFQVQIIPVLEDIKF